jgi:hypothetical protein
MILCGMLDLCRLIFAVVIDLFRQRAAMEAEILVSRQQIIVLRRGRPGRVPLLAVDPMVLGWVCQLFPKSREALAIVRPDTVGRWHRAGFCRYWRWKSRPRKGRSGGLAPVSLPLFQGIRRGVGSGKSAMSSIVVLLGY